MITFWIRNFEHFLLSKLSSKEIDELIKGVSTSKKSSCREESEKILSKQVWKRNEFSSHFLKICGLDLNLLPDNQKTYDDSLRVEKPLNTFKSLKIYQAKIFEKVVNCLSAPRARTMVCMPTGTGKTRTAMEVVCRFLQSENARVLWLVDSPELMYQALECFKETWVHIGLSDVQISLIGFGHKAKLQNNMPEFVIGGLQTLVRSGKEKLKELICRLNLVVFDEAHRLVAPEYNDVVKQLTPVQNETRLLGLSATPIRKDETESQALVTEFYENIIVLPPLLKNRSVFESLTELKFLAVPMWKEINYSPQITLTANEISYLKTNKDISQSALEKFARDMNRNLEILKILLDLGRRKKSTIFFGTTRDQSRQISSALNCLGVKGVHLDSETPKEERRKNIQRFREGQISVICNYGVLTTGFDAPAIEAVVIGRPTTSKTLVNQMIGRGLRGKELGGTDLCEIYVPNDKIVEFINQVEIIELFEDPWKRAYFEN